MTNGERNVFLSIFLSVRVAISIKYDIIDNVIFDTRNVLPGVTLGICISTDMFDRHLAFYKESCDIN